MTRRKCAAGAWALAWISMLVAFGPGFAMPQDDATGVQLVSPPDGGWPKTVKSGDNAITVYQPQAESWDNALLKFRLALSVKVPAPAVKSDAAADQTAGEREAYGVAWVSARTATDKENRIVHFQAMRLDKVSFPSQFDDGASYEQILADVLPLLPHAISLDRLEAGMAVAETWTKLKKIAVKNDPPKFFLSKEPAVLVLIDGKPVMKAVPGGTFQQIINTRSTLLFDPAAKAYYLHLPGVWLSAASLTGAWETFKGDAAALDAQLAKLRAAQAAAAAMKGMKTDPPAGGDAPAKTGGDDDVVITKVLVSTVPAELIWTDGEPRLQAVAGTGLQEVANSPNNIFFDPGAARYFVLVSGRWFTSPDLDDTWAYLPAKDLPQDFLRIPENDPKGKVLASIPNTPQSKEAIIAGTVPQTATVNRKEAKLDVAYDGDPQFKPVEETQLLYAANADVPVVQVGKDYFAVKQGVWFRSVSPNGPWEPADKIPPEIYDIPASSPVHHVTYVNVYNANPDEIFVGYTPGYSGSFIGLDETVVYGTGWYYDPWVGNYWYARPWTWGYDVEMASCSKGGWTWTCAVASTPGWGPWWWGWDYHGGTDDFWAPWWTGMGGWAVWAPIVPFNYNHYVRWNPNVIRETPQLNEWRQKMNDWRQSGNTPWRPASGQRPNNLFAGKDGQVYRRGENGWETHDGKAWKPLAPGAGGEGVHGLERENYGRMLGETRMQSMRMPSMPAGGFGGGFRRR